MFYELTCFVDIPFGRDMKTVQSFRIAPLPEEHSTSPVRVRYPDDKGRGFWDKFFGPDVRVELALARDIISQGESVDGIFQVETEQSVKVRAILARLVGHVT